MFVFWMKKITFKTFHVNQTRASAINWREFKLNSILSTLIKWLIGEWRRHSPLSTQAPPNLPYRRLRCSAPPMDFFPSRTGMLTRKSWRARKVEGSKRKLLKGAKIRVWQFFNWGGLFGLLCVISPIRYDWGLSPRGILTVSRRE